MAKKKIKKRSRRDTLCGSRGWLAVGTLAAYAIGGGAKPALANDSKSGNPATRSGREMQSLPVRRYAIPAGPLKDVLASFQGVSGMPVRLPQEGEAEGVGALSSHGVTGSFTPQEALTRLLADTGLSFKVTIDGAAQLEFTPASVTVNVDALAQNINQSMPKFQGSLLDTPQTVSVVSQKTMQQQGVTTLRDAVRNVAGISLAAGEGGAQGDNLTIRGFTARNDLFIDGMRDFGSYYRDSFNTQEVEVLQGPSSVTFGRGSTGGVVNQATKTPQLNQFINADVQFGTDTTRRATLDWSAPIPKLGKGTSFRLAAMGNIGNVAGRNIALNRRTGIAPSLAFGLGTPTRVTLSFFHQNEDNVPDYGLPWLFNQPAPVNRNNYYGVQGNYLRTYADIGTARVEHDLNDKVTLRNQFRYANYNRAVLISEARVAANATPTTPLAALQVTRNEISVRSTESFLDNQSDVVAHFSTFGLRHTVVSGVEAIRETSNPVRYGYRAPGTSLLNPDYNQQLLPNPTVNSRVQDTAVSVGAYALDTVSLGRHWQASGGIRYDRFDNSYSQTVAPASSFNRVDSKPTWRAAVTYKPVANGSIYVDAGTSFNPSAEALSLSAATANLPPESNKTYELGTKWNFGRVWQVDSAIFRTTKENARESDPNNALLTVLAGTQRVDGAVVNLRGRITNRWDILSSYAYLNSKVVSSRFYPQAIGYPLVNVPRNTFSFWSNGHLPKHFDFGLGTNYVGSRNSSSTVPLDPTTGLVKAVPSYWVFNAMLSHPLNEHMDLQLNGYNLANRFYYDQLHPGHVIPGPGRSLLVGVHFKF